ncbi:MAG: hypothetical protein KGH53_02705 [Candidatus Micrarchaeota archaeon]|nr:hypothetical protein [Candidatus Micrarchaeota archaeon]
MTFSLVSALFRLTAIFSGVMLLILTGLEGIQIMLSKDSFEGGIVLSEAIGSFLLLFAFSTLFYLAFS